MIREVIREVLSEWRLLSYICRWTICLLHAQTIEHWSGALALGVVSRRVYTGTGSGGVSPTLWVQCTDLCDSLATLALGVSIYSLN